MPSPIADKDLPKSQASEPGPAQIQSAEPSSLNRNLVPALHEDASTMHLVR
jgi:hypothetical protein